MSRKRKENKETWLYSFVRGVAAILLWLFYPVKYEGLENIPEGGGYILCSNHRSAMDVIYLGYHVPQQLRFMAKAELFSNKLTSWFFRTMGAFPVQRGRGDLHALDEAADIIRQGGVMAIFPEGTRSRDGKPLPFHSGFAVVASHIGADVLPVAISFEGKLRLRKRATVRFGKLISNESFGFSAEPARSELRNAVRTVQDSILSLTDLPADYEKPVLSARKSGSGGGAALDNAETAGADASALAEISAVRKGEEPSAPDAQPSCSERE